MSLGEQAGPGQLDVGPSPKCFSENFPEGTIHFQVLDLGRQVFVWLSVGSPKLSNMFLAIDSPQVRGRATHCCARLHTSAASPHNCAQRAWRRRPQPRMYPFRPSAEDPAGLTWRTVLVTCRQAVPQRWRLSCAAQPLTRRPAWHSGSVGLGLSRAAWKGHWQWILGAGMDGQQG
jgi:hypothetical protein